MITKQDLMSYLVEFTRGACLKIGKIFKDYLDNIPPDGPTSERDRTFNFYNPHTLNFFKSLNLI